MNMTKIYNKDLVIDSKGLTKKYNIKREVYIF